MLNNLIRSRCPRFKIAFPAGNRKEVDLPLMNIKYIEADGIVSHIHLGEYKRMKVTITQTVGACEKLLKEYAFVRIHRKYLVNYSWIREINTDRGMYCIFYDGSGLPVARRRQVKLLDQLSNFGLDRLLLKQPVLK